MRVKCILLSVQPLLLIAVVPNNVEYIPIRGENITKTSMLETMSAEAEPNGRGLESGYKSTFIDLLSYTNYLISSLQ